MAPPFRGEHIGSLLRPVNLLFERDKERLSLYRESGSDAMKAATQAAIDAVVQKQLELDIRPITTGEFERERFYSGIWEKIEGFEEEMIPVPQALRPGSPPAILVARAGFTLHKVLIAMARLRRTQPLLMDTWSHLTHAVPEGHLKDCKITIPSPTWLPHQLKQNTAYSPGVYNSDREYFSDLAAIYREEFREMRAVGLRNIQIDAPDLAWLIEESYREALEEDGVDPEEFLDLLLWAINECLKDRPEGLHIGIHVDRGNMPGTHGILSGSYEVIAQKLFQQVDVDTFYLEFDDDRSGGFEPLRFVPRGKNVVLGLVSSKEPKLEELSTLAERVHEAAEVMAKAQGRSLEEVLQDSLAVSSQCGYSSMSVGGSPGVTESIMWAKLSLVRDLSRKIWKDAV